MSRYRMAHSILIAISILSVIHSSIAQNTCIALSDSSPCGEKYAGYPIAIPNISTESEFSTYINTHLLDNEIYTSRFATEFGCTPDSIYLQNTIRYKLSFACSSFVNSAKSQNCTTQHANQPTLCQEQCTIHTGTIQQSFLNKNQCPLLDTPSLQNETYQQSRNTHYQSLIQTCSNFSSDFTTTNHCIRGVDSEVVHCGYATREAAEIGCLSHPDDRCCHSLYLQDKGPNIVMYVLIGVACVVSLLVIIWFIHRSIYKKESAKKRTFVLKDTDWRNGAHTGKWRKDDITVPVSAVLGITRPTTPVSHEDLESGLKYYVSNSNDSESRLSEVPRRSRFPHNPINDAKILPTAGGDRTKVMRVTYSYEAGANDEISLKVGERVSILKVFCDGWATGVVGNGEKGIFPLACVEEDNSKSGESKASGLKPDMTVFDEQARVTSHFYDSFEEDLREHFK